MAANLVNTVVDKIDERNSQIISDNKSKILNIFREKVQEKRKEVRALSDTLADLAQNYEIKEKVNQDGELEAIKGENAQKVELYKVLRKRHESAIEDLNELITLEDQYDASSRETVSSLYVVDRAYPAVKKSKTCKMAYLCFYYFGCLSFFAHCGFDY